MENLLLSISLLSPPLSIVAPLPRIPRLLPLFQHWERLFHLDINLTLTGLILIRLTCMSLLLFVRVGVNLIDID